MKHMLPSLLSGAAAGISIELLAAILLSSALHLGYVILCPAWLPECVGGEIKFPQRFCRQHCSLWQALLSSRC